MVVARATGIKTTLQIPNPELLPIKEAWIKTLQTFLLVKVVEALLSKWHLIANSVVFD